MPGKERFTNTRLPIIGGITAAIGASLCCIGPYRPVFVMLVMLLFGWAGWQIHRPVEACEPGTACAVPHTRKRRQIVFWIAVIVALVLVTSTHWIPLFA